MTFLSLTDCELIKENWQAPNKQREKQIKNVKSDADIQAARLEIK